MSVYAHDVGNTCALLNWLIVLGAPISTSIEPAAWKGHFGEDVLLYHVRITLVSHHHVHASHGLMVFLSLVPSPLQVHFHFWNDHPRLFIARHVLLAVRQIGNIAHQRER